MQQDLIQIDLTYFNSITGGDKTFGKRLLSGAISDIDAKVASLKSSWDEKSVKGVKESIHSLISLCAIAGMPTVEKWCRTIENAFLSGRFHEDLTPLANNIISGWPAAQTKLKAVIDEN